MIANPYIFFSVTLYYIQVFISPRYEKLEFTEAVLIDYRLSPQILNKYYSKIFYYTFDRLEI